MDSETREAFQKLGKDMMQQFANVTDQFENVYFELRALRDDMDTGFSLVNDQFKEIDNKFDVVNFNIQSLEQKVDANHKHTNGRFDEVTTQLDGVVGTLSRLDQEETATLARYDRLEHRVIKLETRS